MRILRPVLFWGAIVLVCAAFFGAGFLWRVYHDSSVAFRQARGGLLVAGLRGREFSSATEIYDRHDELISTVFVENRYPIPVDEMSPWVIRGLIATEDKNFYQHGGVDLTGGIMRALIHDIRTGQRHGGSTITQQLAKRLFLVPDQTFQRKIQEAFIAMEIEKQFSKDQILEMYLNQIYFGSGAHGIEAAARTYFGGRHASELTLVEAATLVAIPRAPTRYHPVLNPDNCRSRRNVVISMLEEDGYITSGQADAARAQPLVVDVTRPTETQERDYFTEYVRKYLVSRYGWSAVYEEGLRVYTTLDPEMQAAAEFALDSVLTAKEPVWDPETGEFEEDPERLRYPSSYDRWQAIEDTTSGAPDYVQGAVVALDPRTGYVRAMVGGRDFEDSEFNRAVQASRQPGSSFKAFVYAEAIEQGWSPGSMVLDQPVVVDMDPGFWRPRNYDRRFHGMSTLRRALALSYNVSAVRLGMAVGVEAVAARAHRMGIESRLPIVNSLPLGSAMLNPLEMAQGYIPFATGGLARDATAILRVEDRYGNVLESHEEPDPGTRVLSRTGAYMMNSMLQSVIRGGTATGARWYWGGPYAGREAGGKTGTTSDYADAWFVGFTPDLVASVWVGYDNHVVRLRLQRQWNSGQSGSSIALPVWNRFMRRALADAHPEDAPEFAGPEPGTIEKVVICKTSGDLAVAACAENATEEMFWRGTAPVDYCRIHRGMSPMEGDSTIPDFTEFDRNQLSGGGV